MAVESNKKNTEQQQAATQTSQARSAGGPTPLSSIVRGIRRSSGRANSAAVNKALAVMKSDIADATGDALANFSVLPFIGANLGLNVSGIIVHINTDAGVFYHFIIVAEACELSQRSITLDNASVAIQTTYSDLATDEVFTNIERELANYYAPQGQVKKFYETNVSVLHDAEDAGYIVRTASDSILDLLSGLGMVDGYQFSTESLRGLSPRATVEYNGLQVLNSESQPTRNDISVTVTAAEARDGGEDPYIIPLSRVNGFINLNYEKPQPIQTPHGMVPTTKQFRPEFVITANQSLFQANSLEVLLFSMYGATACLRDNNWLNVFKPLSFVANEENWRDIGAINFDVPPTGNPDVDGRKIDTSTEAFLSNGLYQLANTYFFEDIGFAIDVDETGNQSWLMSLFSRLIPANNTAEALADAEAARKQIIVAADNLTGNHFSQFFDNGPIVLPGSERIHTGTYVGADKELHDIREVDHLAMLNIGGGTEGGMENAFELARTFEKVEIHEEIRLRKRWDMYRGILGETAKHTGWAIRHRLAGNFMGALASAVAANGLSINIEGITAINAAEERGYATMQGYGMNAQAISGNFHVGSQSYHNAPVSRGRSWL